jgi:nicotinate phosphoribosyltransferase
MSTHKPILPGRKQIFRQESGGQAVADVVGRFDEPLDGRPLLQLVMSRGRRTGGAADLVSTRRVAAAELAKLPRRITALEPADPSYPVRISASLGALHLDAQDAAIRAR